jgi:D-amino-acid dehydrogenase
MSRPTVATLANDALVIGGGLIGWSVALVLARRGLAVTVIAGDQPGSATQASAGMITPGTVDNPSPGYAPLAIAASRHYAGFIDSLDDPQATGFAVTGGLLVTETEAELAWLDDTEQYLIARRDQGMVMIGAVERLSAADAVRHLPVLAPDIAGACWYAGGARLNGRDLLNAVRKSAIGAGARQINVAASLALTGSRLSVRLTDGSPLEGEAIVVAAGAWTADLLKPFGYEIPINPQRGQLIHLDDPTASARGWPVLETRSHHYLIGLNDNHIVCGATRENDSGFDSRVTPTGLREVLGHALRLVPSLGRAAVIETRVGLRPLTPDGLPMIGALPGIENGWICAGHGGLGLTLGPYSAELLGQMITGAPPAIDPTPYRIDRWAIGAIDQAANAG